MKKHLLAAAAVVAMSGTSATAASLSGEFWDLPANTISTINEAISAVAGGAAPTTATFTATDIDYGDAGNNWVIGSLSTFLAGDAGSIVGSDPSSMQESVFRISGKVALNDGDQIDVTSDDGFRLVIDGKTFSEFTGIRAPNNTTSGVWNGGSGLFDATLWYFEGQFTQAQLRSNLVDYAAPIPVPAAGFLLVGALGGLVVARRRKPA